MTAALNLEIWFAVDKLVKPARRRTEATDGRWVKLPSLLEQLREAIETGRGGSGRTSQGSRPPLDIVCVSLLAEITDGLARECKRRNLEPTQQPARDMRKLVGALVAQDDEALLEWWVGRLRSWASQIRTAVSNDEDRPWNLHGAPCPSCGVKTVIEQQDDEPVRRPAVIITWGGGYVRAVECSACGSVWHRGEALDQLVDRMLDGRSA